MGSATAFAGTPEWKLSESSGPVMISRAGFQSAAVRGGALRAGDTISTGKAGRAVLIRGDEYLVVSPGSRIVIAEPKTGSMTQIIQSLGSTLFKIKKMATPHFAVQTPYLAAVVKGTTFSVTVTNNGASVQVTEGRVQVATPDGGASYLVTPGEIGLVKREMPFRLTVQGRETVTIDSPAKPADSAPVEPALTTDATTETASALDAAISDAVSEGPVTLEAVSGGMISGDSSLAVAQTSNRLFETALLVDPRPQTPDVPSVPVIDAPGQLSDLPPAPLVDTPVDNVGQPGIPTDAGASAPAGDLGSGAGSASENGSSNGPESAPEPGETNGGSSESGNDASGGATDDGKDKGDDGGKGKGDDGGQNKKK